MFIANNTVFKSIISFLLSQVNSTEGVLPMMNSEKQSFYSF